MSVRSRIAFLSALAVITAGNLHGFAIDSVRQRNYTEAQLTTLGEYLGRSEHYGRRTYLRTDQGKRAGLYLIADLDEKLSTLPEDTVVVLDIVRSSDGQYKTFTLSLADAKGSKGKALYLGITNPEDSSEKLLAWKITFQNKKGVVLTEKHSFLWAMPKGN
jgi:hypothetical protein